MQETQAFFGRRLVQQRYRTDILVSSERYMICSYTITAILPMHLASSNLYSVPDLWTGRTLKSLWFYFTLLLTALQDQYPCGHCVGDIAQKHFWLAFLLLWSTVYDHRTVGVFFHSYFSLTTVVKTPLCQPPICLWPLWRYLAFAIKISLIWEQWSEMVHQLNSLLYSGGHYHIKYLAAVCPRSHSPLQYSQVPPKSTTLKESIHHADLSEPGKEDSVDWGFWLVPEALSTESLQSCRTVQYGKRSDWGLQQPQRIWSLTKHHSKSTFWCHPSCTCTVPRGRSKSNNITNQFDHQSQINQLSHNSHLFFQVTLASNTFIDLGCESFDGGSLTATIFQRFCGHLPNQSRREQSLHSDQ